MSYLAKAKKLQQMMGEGKMMEAFEELYHSDVVVKEPSGEVRKGKAEQRKANQQWRESLQEVHGSGVKSITSDEENGITCTETWFDCTFKDGNRWKMEEVGVQKWKDGQIIEERFYYDVPKQ